ncbi:MAG: hypothetical protein PSV22_01895 [Pseudolabrys sp.]|nr:hypothetical protein [Pseudolabrys sp.]
MPFKNKSNPPDRIGLSLHKHLVPHVLEKAPVLNMNPNEFVNACVKDCVNGMTVDKDPGPGAPGIVQEYRSRSGMNPQPVSQRFNDAEYALLRSLDEILYDLNLAKECVLSGTTTSAILSPAIIELLRTYQQHRSLLLARAPLFDGKKGYQASQTGI